MIQDIEDQDFGNNEMLHRKSTLGTIAINKQFTKDTIFEMASQIELQAESESLRECRICLQDNQESNDAFIAPCKCTGSVQYVHDKCFRMWVQKQFDAKSRENKNKIIHEGIECELCKSKIGLNITQKCACNTSASFCHKVNSNKAIFILCLLFLMANCGSTVYLSIYTKQNISFSGQNASTLVNAIIICCFAFLGISTSLLVYYFLKEFLLSRKWALESFKIVAQGGNEPSSPSRRISSVQRVNPQLSIEPLQSRSVD